jgi:hypothetical protein
MQEICHHDQYELVVVITGVITKILAGLLNRQDALGGTALLL